MAIGSKLILEQCDSTHESAIESGKLLIRTDEGALYIDTDDGRRVRVGDLVQADSLAAVIPQDGKIYKVDGVLYTLRDGELKPVSEPFPVGTILPYLGIGNHYSYVPGDFLNSFFISAPSGWHLCDGSVFVDCTADPREGESLYFGHNYNVYSESNTLNRLCHFNNDTLVMCFYYYYYPYLKSDGTYGRKYDIFVKPERTGYLKTGDIADRSEYGLVYYKDYVSDDFKNSEGEVTLPNKVSSLDMLNHTYESENSAKVSAIDETPFLILNGELYRLVSYTSDTIYRWKKDGAITYRYTRKSETILNDKKPVCYTTTSLSTSDGTATYCYMVPLYPAFGPYTIMRGYLPNLNGLMPFGTDNANLTGAMLPATLPNITGTMNNPFGGSSSNTVNELLRGTGAIYEDTATGTRYSAGSASTARRRLKFDASLCNTIYQDGATVRPPSFGVNWIIKIE